MTFQRHGGITILLCWYSVPKLSNICMLAKFSQLRFVQSDRSEWLSRAMNVIGHYQNLGHESNCCTVMIIGVNTNESRSHCLAKSELKSERKEESHTSFH